MMTAILRGKRRRSWFLSLILVSLVLTVLSGGYLLNQLPYQKDIGPSKTPLTDNDDTRNDIPIDPGSGPRRDRNRGKKPRPPPPPPPKESGIGTPSPEKGKVDPGSDGNNKPTDNNNQVSPDNHEPHGLRICTLEDLIHGQWIASEKQEKVPVPLWTPDQDLSWTGYGRSGCRSSIWNERYLLTPSTIDNTTILPNKALLQLDQEHAWQLKKYRWQVDHAQDLQNKGHGQETHDRRDCWQPAIDVEDFVEVLKRAPLVMIGDKFLEQEYLAMECMIMGMQDQLVFNYMFENNGAVSKEEALESLEYRIESEMPPIVELKVAPGSSTLGAAPRSSSSVYRKAKPGEMRLIDRVSNRTLLTFIRSDVLWDSGMLASLVAKHALKSVAELSTLDASGLHPDCKLVGTVLLCEPARIDTHTGGSRGVKGAGSNWWQWLIGAKEAPVAPTDETSKGSHDDDEDMSFGSDLDHDMINLEWVQSLESIVRDAAIKESDTERKPVVMISNGHFWEFDPQDSIGRLLRNSDRKLSKTEEEMIKTSQDKRRKLLRQRYTMMLSNTLDYIKGKYPDLRVVVQMSVRRSNCDESKDTAARDTKDQEAAILNALAKTVVARMQDPLYSFVDTTFLRTFQDLGVSKHSCSNFMMPDL
ncbi:hypothetical protein BGX31_003175 [Mortierella sp. GBA43]|nr:hypothetical protein BGX31_003175 [Mortierella sp. GBA43]